MLVHGHWHWCWALVSIGRSWGGLYCPPVIPAKLGWFSEVEVGRWALPELSRTETSPEG